MANFGLLLALVSTITGAIGVFIWNNYNSKSNTDKHKELVDKGDSIKKGVEHLTGSERLFVSPSEIVCPAKMKRDAIIVVTNNFPNPIFMVTLEIKVVEGDLDLTKDLALNCLLSGVQQPKYFSCQIPAINARSAFNIAAIIDAGKYQKTSKIKLSIAGYTDEPMPNFSMDSVKELPKTIQLPKGFIPEVHKNDTDK